jgi:hypothetical protein
VQSLEVTSAEVEFALARDAAERVRRNLATEMRESEIVVTF